MQVYAPSTVNLNDTSELFVAVKSAEPPSRLLLLPHPRGRPEKPLGLEGELCRVESDLYAFKFTLDHVTGEVGAAFDGKHRLVSGAWLLYVVINERIVGQAHIHMTYTLVPGEPHPLPTKRAVPVDRHLGGRRALGDEPFTPPPALA